MTRPRLAALISAIVASAVAFLVVRRWGLAGTLTGAAVIPVVYTLVSHWSAEGLDHLGRWMRRRVLRRDGVEPPEEQSPVRRHSLVQWSVAAFAVLALVTSIYALSVSGPTEKTVVRERVVQMVVTVTAPDAGSSADTSAPAAPTTTTSSQEPTTVSSEPTTTTTDVVPGTDATSTTAAPGPGGTVSTVVTVPSTTVLP